MNQNQLDQLCINTIRALAMDGVQKANSGHPGMPMGAADMAYVLWTHFLKHNPTNPHWIDRDRFVLSAGHGSMLLYSLLHLTGYDLSIEDLKNFRQWGSRTPGHPEYELTPGVETTTGPLGQGISTSVGMAIAERFLANHFNRPGHTVIDHYCYGICGDGDMMEGVASEAASLAGHLKLGKLIYLYDSNRITIDGSTDLAFTEDVGKRFEAYGWHVQTVSGYDLEALDQAILAAQAEVNKPSLVIAETNIAKYSPNKQDSSSSHGSPLGEDEVKLTKQAMNWPLEPTFYVPEESQAHFLDAVKNGQALEAEWQDRFAQYKTAYPDLAAELDMVMAGRLPEGWDEGLPTYAPADGEVATRSASGAALQVLAKHLPTLLGGSADLSPSNSTTLKGLGDMSADNPGGRNVHFGVREHGMGAILNGLALHGGIIPFGATFLTFADYMRPPMRLSALMKLRVIYVFTHDSIAVGEDGPTHQPIAHLSSLRAIPNLTVIRPADANETVVAWKVALEHTTGPTCLVLSRQGLPVLDQSTMPSAEGLRRGAYILVDAADGKPDIILMGTGSELSLCVDAAEELAKARVKARVVSMPSFELFNAQPKAYQDEVLPPSIASRLAVEAGATQCWYRYIGMNGDVIGMDHFGASAPGPVVQQKFGFTAENVVQHALALLGK